MNSRSLGTLCLKLAAPCLALALVLLAPSQAYATTDTDIYDFHNNMTSGGVPYSGLVMDSSRNLYGVTSTGGANSHGYVFEISPSGSGWTTPPTSLHDFAGGTDGITPYAQLTLVNDNTLYGTATGGGGSSGCSGGCGTVFKLTLSGGVWTYSQLWAFTGGTSDGQTPYGSVFVDSNGDLFGTTYYGGANSIGAVWEIPSGGSEKLIYSFSTAACGSAMFGCGVHPTAGVIGDSSGNLWGTAHQGGNTSDCGTGCGTVYELSPGSPWSPTLIHPFTGGMDGATPFYGSLLIDSNGNIYGTTVNGGASNDGTVFEIPSGGSYGKIFTFTNGANDADLPEGPLIIDSSGNLYGTTTAGGAHSLGIVFKLAPPVSPSTLWTPSRLYSFAGGTSDGQTPYGGVVFDTNAGGTLYGTTENGGAHSDGMVFSVP